MVLFACTRLAVSCCFLKADWFISFTAGDDSDSDENDDLFTTKGSLFKPSTDLFGTAADNMAADGGGLFDDDDDDVAGVTSHRSAPAAKDTG